MWLIWCLLNIKVGKSTRPRSCRLRKEVQRPEAFGDGSQGGRSQNFPSAGSSAMSGLLSHVVIIINLHGRLRLTQTNEGTNMNQLFWRLNHPYTPWSWTKSTSTWIISQILASSDWAGDGWPNGGVRKNVARLRLWHVQPAVPSMSQQLACMHVKSWRCSMMYPPHNKKYAKGISALSLKVSK